jgi:enamine deaminase RidA (YjgF/YER057c/UK114 family)
VIGAIRPSQFPWFDYSRYTFSLGLTHGDHAYLSGHSASEYDPHRDTIVVRGGMAEQARTAYAKIERILEEAGKGFRDVVRLVENVTVAGIDRYHEAETVRAEVFGDHRPAVNTVVVNRLLRPAAWIEIEAVAGGLGDETIVDSPARPAYSSARATDGVVYLSSILPVDRGGDLVGEGDIAAQTRQIYQTAGRVLEAAGLRWTNVVKTVDYLTPAGLPHYRHTGRVRREFLVPDYPGATGILMQQVRHPGALIQVDFIASVHEPIAVNPGWSRYGKLTYSPAVRAGNVLFMSGQAALDPETERAMHAGDVAAQAEYTYANILQVLEAGGCGPEHLVKTVEYVTPSGLGRYRDVAEVRRRHLKAPWPASTGIVCQALLRPEFEIEIDPMAILPVSET